MNRRTFVLLSGAALLRLPKPGGLRPAATAGGLQFDLDDQRRLSLWYHGAAQPVPVFRNASVGVWVGDQLATLADLEDISVGNRRPPGGESLVIRGRTRAEPTTGSGGVWIEAEFTAWDTNPNPGAGAIGTITVSVYPDRVLATIRGVRFFAAPEPQVLPGVGPLVALANGYQSGDSCRVVAVPADVVSHGALGLTREAHGLGIVCEPGDAGDARIKLGGEQIEAGSEWTPSRPLRPEGDAATLRLAFLPAGDGLAALAAAATPVSSVDRERLASLTTPTGWSSRSELGAAVTEDDVLANLDFCAAHFDPRFFRFVQIDDGYQRAAGEWETNERFPHGHRWLTDRIHAAGFQAGVWMAPFAVSEKSPVATANPAWLLKDNSPLVVDARESWGGRIHVLDGAHPDVQQWLYDLARRVVRDWGYDFLKVDFLHWATAGAGHHGGLTHAEAYRRGLAAIRDGLGTEAFLLGCGAPLQHAAGLVNGLRIGPDVGASWGGILPSARAAALRGFYQRAVWLNDPDCLVVRAPLSIDEARVWASIVAVSGGITMLSDDLPKLPPERLPLLQKTLPVAVPHRVARTVGTQTDDKEVAPAVVVGDTVVRIRGPWRFRTGDDARYAAREYDDEAWEAIAVPLTWEQSNHAEYDGAAWYRTRFTLPPSPAGREPANIRLELGKIDDIDETFVNGARVGGTNGWRAYRHYPLPAAALNWGGENVLAIRVTDAGGPGGFWGVRRDRPAGSWVVEGAPRWWTVVLVNWDDEPQAVTQNLAALGIAGSTRFHTYDVWAELPHAGGDVQQALTATIAPHSTLTVALRPLVARPQIVGTTRHVIQGAVDITDERWDAATRTLAAKSVNLDGRAYAVTIAVPRGLRPGVCKADAPCTVKRLPSGHAVVEWPAGVVNDLSWSLSFRRATSAR